MFHSMHQSYLDHPVFDIFLYRHNSSTLMRIHIHLLRNLKKGLNNSYLSLILKHKVLKFNCRNYWVGIACLDLDLKKREGCKGNFGEKN